LVFNERFNFFGQLPHSLVHQMEHFLSLPSLLALQKKFDELEISDSLTALLKTFSESHCGHNRSQVPGRAGQHKPTMKIFCVVNQAECFRRGINAPASTVKIEINPAKLPEDLRAFIADNLLDGYKLGFKRLRLGDPDAGKSKEYADSEFMLYRPDLLGFMEAVLRAKEFMQANAEESNRLKYLSFDEWIKNVDAAANVKRDKRAKELADAQSEDELISKFSDETIRLVKEAEEKKKATN
jgi:hypothetical protein